MKKSRLVIATTTMYSGSSRSDEVRARLAVALVKKAAAFDIPIVVVDAGSQDQYVMEFVKNGAVVEREKVRGKGPSRRQAIARAHDLSDRYVAWVDPEKVDVVQNLTRLAAAMQDANIPLLLPRRESLESYPNFQQLTEQVGNYYIKELTGLDLDLYFGLRIWDKNLTHYFIDYDGMFGDEWESIFIPVLHMLADSVPYLAPALEYFQPVTQTESEQHSMEFHQKRLDQLAKLSSHLTEFWETYKK